MVENESFILSNEFAEVKVEWERQTSNSFRSPTLARAQCRSWTPGDAIRIPERDLISAGGVRSAEVSVDYAANGPRLEIANVGTGVTIYLDPLQFADAAIAGAWGKLPPGYDMQ